MDKANPDSFEYIESHDDNYFKLLIERHLKQNPTTNFYISTDSESTLTELKKIFGDKIINNPFKTFYLWIS